MQGGWEDNYKSPSTLQAAPRPPTEMAVITAGNYSSSLPKADQPGYSSCRLEFIPYRPTPEHSSPTQLFVKVARPGKLNSRV